MSDDLDDLLPSDFDAAATAAAAGDGTYDPLPVGWYTVRVERSEMKDTKSGGKMLSVALVVEAPRLEGRWVFATYNLKNASANAQNIAIESFARLCTACGLTGRPRQTRELDGKRCDVKLKIERSDKYDDQNRVVGYASPGTRVANSAAAPGVAHGRNPNVNYDAADEDLPF